jgi:hypothetical protein
LQERELASPSVPHFVPRPDEEWFPDPTRQVRIIGTTPFPEMGTPEWGFIFALMGRSIKDDHVIVQIQRGIKKGVRRRRHVGRDG